MNKLEFLEKTEEVRELIAEGKYDLAVEICDTLNLNGVKDTRELQNIAKAYERCRRYDEAERLLQRVRKAAPRSRSVLFRLCVVAARAGQIEDAKDYLSDFIDLAPTDPERYILEYRIAEAEGSSDNVKIGILEKYLSEETDDRWMYTLADLYVKNGREEEAAGVLNAIILWFDSGKYVARAHAMLVKLGYEDRPEDPMGDIPVASETKAEFPDVEFEEPEEIQSDEEEEEAEEAEAETEDAEAEESEAAEAEGEAEAEFEEDTEEAEDAAETEGSEEPEAAVITEESVEEFVQKEDEHVVMNITAGRESDYIRPRVDEEDEEDWRRVFDEADDTEKAAGLPEEEPEFAGDAPEFFEDAPETGDEAFQEEAVEEEVPEEAKEYPEEAEEYSEEAEEALAEESEEAALEVSEEAEAYPEEEYPEAAGEFAEFPEELPEEPEAVEDEEETEIPAAKEAAPVEPAEDAPIINFKNDEYGEVIAAEIRRRKEARLLFGNIPLEPEMSTGIWHFIAYGDTDELALECAREHVKEIAGINSNCPRKLLKISAEKIGGASIVSSMDRFLGNVVIVEHASLLSDDQLSEFAKMLDKDDMSLLIVFTDTKENVTGILKRVPDLANIFSAVYEGKKYTAEELVQAAEYYLKTEEARMTPEAEQIVRDYAESLLEEKAGFYRNRVIAFTSKALEAADRGGFLGFGAGKIDKNGILVIDAKHFKNL